MPNITFCTAGASPALTYARNQLTAWGYEVTDTPHQTVTHLLLPVPSLDSGSAIRGGPELAAVLSALPPNVTVLGGMLPPLPCPAVDFLQDEYYVTENAAITAQCACHLAAQYTGRDFADVPILVIGWGRIGKCLVKLLTKAGARVSVAVRKDCDAAALKALQVPAIKLPKADLQPYQILFNTAPAPLFHQSHAANHALLMDLASVRGIEGDRVLWERGLPGRMAPEASGALIAKTALRFALRKE